MKPVLRLLGIRPLASNALTLLLVGCPPPDRVETVSLQTNVGPRVDTALLPAAPWQRHPPLDPASTPAVVRAEWQKADNRRTCALLALAPGPSPEPAPRRARFGGGWAVAYDRPGARSAWGVAGTGSALADDPFDDWPFRQSWADGSRAGYGPEGGTGPHWLAYLSVPGQACLYNVWSADGRAPLEALLERLRFVAGHGAPGSVGGPAS